MDYLVLSRSLMKNVINSEVLPPNLDSKHAPITVTFKSSFVNLEKEKCSTTERHISGINRVLLYFTLY